MFTVPNPRLIETVGNKSYGVVGPCNISSYITEVTLRHNYFFFFSFGKYVGKILPRISIFFFFSCGGLVTPLRIWNYKCNFLQGPQYYKDPRGWFSLTLRKDVPVKVLGLV